MDPKFLRETYCFLSCGVTGVSQEGLKGVSGRTLPCVALSMWTNGLKPPTLLLKGAVSRATGAAIWAESRGEYILPLGKGTWPVALEL